MKKIKASIIGVVVFLVLICAVSAVDATTVSVEPATQTVKSGDPFSAYINITDVTYMGMDQATLNFDPSAMQVTAIIEGDWLKNWPSGGGTLAITDIDNTAGTASFTYALKTRYVGATGSGTLATINFDTVASAECTFDLTLTDVALADGDSNPITVDYIIDGEVKLDDTPPTVEIISPEEGEWFYSGDILITFHPWDNKDDVLDYTVSVDGEEKASGTADNCTEEVVNLGEIPDCDHMITVEVTDDVGLTGSASVTIHVDRTPPTVEIISPEEGEWFDSEEVVLIFHPWDNKADSLDYTVYLDGDEFDSGTVANCTEKTVPLGVLSECDHVIRVNVTDEGGKTNFSEVTIHVDLTPLIMAILTPIEGKNYSSTCVKLNVSAVDTKSGIDNMWYSLDGGDNETLYDNGNAGAVVYGEAIVSNLDPCGHTIVVYVNNTVGKVNSSEVSFIMYPGDICPDKKVDGLDLQRLAWAFGSSSGGPNWNERADLDCSSKIDGLDLQRLAWNFGNNYAVICGGA